MNVEIAICTWNRSRLLRQTLDSIESTRLPQGIKLRVIVVNNNSTDDTVDVIASFQKTLDIQCFDEPRQGHSYSRNRAVQQARGELLIWTDDDVIVDSNWITAYVNAAKDDREYSFWGGRIDPVFETKKPKWIHQNWDKLSGCFAARDLGGEAIQLTPETLPYGANFAIRTEMQKCHLFETDLGRKPAEVLGEDEFQLFRRLLSEGHRGGWVPGAILKHVVDASRATESYVRQYFVGQGRALAANRNPWSNDAEELMRQAKWESACYRVKRYFTPADTWLSHMIRGALAKGQALELSSLNRANSAGSQGNNKF